jgi:hypothetical protein
MELQIAEKILEASRELGFECTLNESYSGRGMYGNTTAALIFEKINHFVASVVYVATEIKDEDEDICDEDIIETAIQMQQDNMGLRTIIY